MDIDIFFKRIIDEYLFLDLKNMAAIDQIDGEAAGAVGYPMIATILPAMELLGGLIEPDEYEDTASAGHDYFIHYWTNYMVAINPSYRDFGEIFYNLIRHGTAHTFITKTGITVTKNQPEKHLYQHEDNGRIRLNVDCSQLLIDFRASYTKLKNQLQTKSFADKVQRNINTMLELSETKSQKFFSKYLESNSPKSTDPLTTTTTTQIPSDVAKKLAAARKKIMESNTARSSGASLITQSSMESLNKSLGEEEAKQDFNI